MDLFSKNDIISILKKCGILKTSNLSWTVNDYSDQLVGYLGEYLSLTIFVEVESGIKEMKFFIKCIPRFDEWKANYLKETAFFNKEYVMLSTLFKNFQDAAGVRKWRPKLLNIKEELFVFEDVTYIGYTMPNNLNTLSYNELMATVTTLARFHAQSYIFEERKSKELKRPYQIWEDYSKNLCEPAQGQSWRDTGMKAAIDLLKMFSQFKSELNFIELIEKIVPQLFISADKLMKPSSKIRNVVIHRDLWSNNIFLKKQEDGKFHALIIDFQTVLYSPPMLDLSSLIYFNTTKSFRYEYTQRIVEFYYDVLSEELILENINIQQIINKKHIMKSYEESIVFALTQAALIVPIVSMTNEKRKQCFSDPDTCYKINCISRSQEFIEIAKENLKYRKRVIELLDEIVVLLYPLLEDHSSNYHFINSAKAMDIISESDVTSDCITDELIKEVIENSIKEDVVLKKYIIFNASDKMLGFLADYWKLQIQVSTCDNKDVMLCFFIKAISKSNAAKADMVNEMKLFEKETTFYTVIKDKLNTPDIKPWSPNLVLQLKEAMIFEDLNCLQYKTRNKFKTFDREHTLLALEALARFHAATINYEEKRSQSLKKKYYINDDHNNDLNEGGYRMSDPWFTQCMVGALEVVKLFSKYSTDKKRLNLIENRWKDVWKTALRLADFSFNYRNVICHRDVWNNNILFRYTKLDGKSVPDDCLLVDFQAVRYQPPAGDVMLLLYCNLEPKFREDNMATFLNHYYNELKNILSNTGVSIKEILPREDFLKSCEEQKLWGLVVSACLVPQFWIDDELNTKIFCNTSKFQEIMTRDKASFIKSMMEKNNDYKNKVLNILEEIVEQYCL